MSTVKNNLRNLITTVTMSQIDATHLSVGVINALDGREAFKDADADLNERIYTGDVFAAILGEMGEEKKITGGRVFNETEIAQLEALNDLSIHEYFQIINI